LEHLSSHGHIIYFIDQARRVGIRKYAFNVDPAVIDSVGAEAGRESATGQTAMSSIMKAQSPPRCRPGDD